MLRVAEQYAGTDTGRQRRANEDSMLARAPLFVVADGMGGAQAGEVASRIAVEAFEPGVGDAAEPEAALATLAQQANARIYELSHSHAEQAGMGTTLTAVYVGEREVSIAHVGDSRAYRLRDGALERLTDDHSLVDELIRQGRLTPEEAVEHPQRSVITRALGPEGIVEVDTRSFAARDGDVYLLCSDGLTTMLDEQLIAATLGAHATLRDAGEALIAAANEAGGRDNITVVLLRVEELDTSTAPLTEESPAVRTAATRTPQDGAAAFEERPMTGSTATAAERERPGLQARAEARPVVRRRPRRPAPTDQPRRRRIGLRR
ncbi:MAG TPA: Stp1/IreP family PP2C-type Ser/Thr phosphatase, partial [Solirubrobacteraceae bacterium]